MKEINNKLFPPEIVPASQLLFCAKLCTPSNINSFLKQTSIKINKEKIKTANQLIDISNCKEIIIKLGKPFNWKLVCSIKNV